MYSIVADNSSSSAKKFVVTHKLTIRMIYKAVMRIYGSKAGTFKLTMIEIKLETLKTE